MSRSRSHCPLYVVMCFAAALPAASAADVVREYAPSNLDLLRHPGVLRGPTVQVTVDDPVYHGKKRYEAVPLHRVVARAPGFDSVRSSDAEIIFHCRDGYRPAMPLQVLLKSKGFIALRDLDAGKRKWITFDSAAGPSIPAPYYVVWQDVPRDDLVHPWPYQVERIEIVPPEEAFGKARPGSDPVARQGFTLFRQHCMKCHSINLTGGAMGSELNVPRSVVEYWNAHDLRAFLRDPGSVRARSRMPALSNLSDSDLDTILAYLTEMSRRKICESASDCRAPVRTAQQPRRERQ
jgi:mono/diheme cytochrome c family protein/rhodanese-related sulfurtransferase